MWAKWLHNPCHVTDPQSREGYINPTILGAHMWEEWLHNPFHIGDSQSGEKSEVPTEPLFGDPHVDKVLT